MAVPGDGRVEPTIPEIFSENFAQQQRRRHSAGQRERRGETRPGFAQRAYRRILTPFCSRGAFLN